MEFESKESFPFWVWKEKFQIEKIVEQQTFECLSCSSPEPIRFSFPVFNTKTRQFQKKDIFELVVFQRKTQEETETTHLIKSCHLPPLLVFPVTTFEPELNMFVSGGCLLSFSPLPFSPPTSASTFYFMGLCASKDTLQEKEAYLE